MTTEPMTQEQGHQVLLEQVYLPAFLEKCGEYNVVFQSQEDLEDALENVQLLKHAQARQSPVPHLNKIARQHLCHSLGIYPNQEKRASDDAEIPSQIVDALRAAVNG